MAIIDYQHFKYDVVMGRTPTGGFYDQTVPLCAGNAEWYDPLVHLLLMFKGRTVDGHHVMVHMPDMGRKYH